MSPQEIVELLGNIFIIVGAVSITFFPVWSLKPTLFFSFLIGHVIWLIAGFAFYDPMQWRIIMLNGGFIIIDSIAIWKRVLLNREKDGNPEN